MRESRSLARCQPGPECMRLAHRPRVEPAKLANRTEGRSLRGTSGPTSHEARAGEGEPPARPLAPARAVRVASRALRGSPQPTGLGASTSGAGSRWDRSLARVPPVTLSPRLAGARRPGIDLSSRTSHRGMCGSCGYTRTRPSPSSHPRCRSPERRDQVHKTHLPRQREAKPGHCSPSDVTRTGTGVDRWCPGWPGRSSRRILVAVTSPPADPGPDPPDASTDGPCTSPPRAPLRSAQEVMTEPGGVQQSPDLLRERSGPPRHRGRGRCPAVDPGHHQEPAQGLCGPPSGSGAPSNTEPSAASTTAGLLDARQPPPSLSTNQD